MNEFTYFFTVFVIISYFLLLHLLNMFEFLNSSPYRVNIPLLLHCNLKLMLSRTVPMHRQGNLHYVPLLQFTSMHCQCLYCFSICSDLRKGQKHPELLSVNQQSHYLCAKPQPLSIYGVVLRVLAHLCSGMCYNTSEFWHVA